MNLYKRLLHAYDSFIIVGTGSSFGTFIRGQRKSNIFYVHIRDRVVIEVYNRGGWEFPRRLSEEDKVGFSKVIDYLEDNEIVLPINSSNYAILLPNTLPRMDGL